jgi:hypothetical protein
MLREAMLGLGGCLVYVEIQHRAGLCGLRRSRKRDILVSEYLAYCGI